ncbi:MAG: MFS transporter [Streptosporangiaceae bacterium]
MAWTPEAQITSRKSGIPPDGQPAFPVAAEPRTTFAEVLGIAEFRALWSAQIVSVIGDQLARVAITLLVFDRTHSALLAAIAYTASVVPSFVGGVALAGLADRWPRRRVMIACDLIRVALVGLMTLPSLSVGVLVLLLFLVTMVGAPFSSARAALYPDILAGDRYVLGTAVTQTTIQFAQVIGFASGGAAVAFLGVRASLLADAVTFMVSAVIAWLWVRARPAAQPRRQLAGPGASGIRAGLRLVFTSTALLVPMLFGWLSAFYNVPEGIAAPLGRNLGGGDVAVGLILAAGAFGASVGGLLFGRLVMPRQRLRWMSPLAVLSCAVLILFALRPPLVLALLILTVSGVCGCYQLAASAAFVRATPGGQRSQAFGLAQGGMNLGQGVAMIMAGAAAQHYAPSDVIAVAGLLGVCAAMSVAALRRARTRTGGTGAPSGSH